ncbi:MAG: 3',5'-cyclic-nucleotide phosphodiesterase [Pyrinomonadaceae bacterium]|nr:3',5'-cyclic-nucleotide phosphodiesterase [Pyrinomonadaceae bacterium]
MKLQLLPSTFEKDGSASLKQHLASFVIDDCVALDAGSLAMSATPLQRKNIRDVVLTHAHLDHIAGLPLFVDDLFATLESPIRVHGQQEVIESLENHIFNWEIYPRFSELTNENGSVLEYHKFSIGETLAIKHLKFRSVSVNHKVPTVGFIIKDEASTIAFTSDTSKMSEFWNEVNNEKSLDAILIECAFPNGLANLAGISHHLTPKALEQELTKLRHGCPIYVINVKPMYRDSVADEISGLEIPNLSILEVGKIYEW